MNLQDILKSTWFQQTAPLIVLFLIPTLGFFFSRFLRQLWYSFSSFNLPPSLEVFGVYRSLRMGLESLGLSWLWSGSSSSSSSTSNRSSSRRHKKKSSEGSLSKPNTVRSRADQVALRDVGKQKQDYYDSESDDASYYPGLVNISGTYCFMNSTLQAMASLSYLQPQIQAIQAKAEALDVPTPVIDALQELFTTLNTPKSRYNALRPEGMIAALSCPPSISSGSSDSATLYRTSASLFNSREHQDAQELFQLVSECIKNEMAAVDRESQRDRGIAAVLDLTKKDDSKEGEEDLALSSKSVFDGLTANRRSCVVCGYTEAVMHFGFDNWQLAVPRLATSCRLEDCLEDYTRLEILKDCICRNCSILATHKRLLQELKTLEEALANPATPTDPSSSAMPSASSSTSPSKPKPSTSKKKRYKEVKKMEQRVRTAISEGRIEDDALLEGVRLEKVVSPASTKQAMIARPPPVLALHLNRSVHYGQFAAKNTIRVYFPEVLDLTPYTTSGSLSTVPTSSISTPSPPPTQSTFSSPSPFQFQVQKTAQPSSGASDVDSTTSSSHPHPRRPTTPTPETYANGHQRTIYRLAAVVCHYGQHSFGHYICYRRKPRRLGGKWVPPTLVDPLRFEDEIDEEEDPKKANRSASHSNNKSKSKPKKTPNYSGSSSLGESRYYWEDRSEELAGTGRGWLRISDDSVSECGIESVLAEGSAAFMLYYEKAVHPKPGVYLRKERPEKDAKTAQSRSRGLVENGHAVEIVGDDRSAADGDTDGDAFSIGSEETLKPEMRVMDLNMNLKHLHLNGNGSVRSLLSEVGVGVMKVPKKEKEKDRAKKLEKHDSTHSMSMSVHLPLPSSASSASSSSSMSRRFGARIIRSVNARKRYPETASSSATSSSISPPSSTSASTELTTPSPPPSVNGSARHSAEEDQDLDEKAWADMTASAPSILPTQSTSKGHSLSKALGSKSTKVLHHHPSGVKAQVAQ